MYHRHCPRPLRPSSSNQALIASAVLAALAASLPAQLQLTPLPRRALPSNGDPSATVAIADFDGNGAPDIVVGNAGGTGHQNSYYLNDGYGGFVDLTAVMPAFVDNTTTVAYGDVDGDGDLDIVWGSNQGHQNRLWLNTGLFTDVTATQMPAFADNTGSVVLGDVDGDGDLDLFVGNSTYPGEQSRLYLNDGAGTFTDVTSTNFPAASLRTGSLVAGDLDGDGDLDVVLGNRNQLTNVYLNDGSGVFTDATAGRLQAFGLVTALALADVDADSDLDLVVGNYYFQPNVLYLNDGAGVFTAAPSNQLPAPAGRRTVELVFDDMDGDGDLDLVVANKFQQHQLYLNDGAGAFTDVTATRLPTSTDHISAMAVGDVDLDGDPDLIFANAGPNPLYVNVQRQLDAPVAPQIGQPYDLDAYLRYGPSSSVDLAAIYVSTAPASIALPPFGTVGIDPLQAAPFPTLVVPQPAGVASVTVTIPNALGLVGQTLYSQAMLVAFPDDLRLSNVVVDVIQ